MTVFAIEVEMPDGSWVRMRMRYRKRNTARSWRHDGKDVGDQSHKCHIAELEAENKRLREALTPSAETKAAYIGEFSWLVNVYGTETELFVPWSTVKEIMAAIRKRANPDPV